MGWVTTFSKIFQLEMQRIPRQSPFLCLFSPQRQKRKKPHFLFFGRFHSLLVALRSTQTERNKTDQTDDEAKLFRSSIKTTHRGLTSLTFMQLVSGADRVVHHICVRCNVVVVKSVFFIHQCLRLQMHKTKKLKLHNFRQ